ncbi:hypothetical protein [Ideonella oryzae]|uniref:DUF2946 domain-containing protein n=1 Tax=Ideonella oryzae TaxID=2937441 RepID=A0ABT1BGQ8_9BURK|nr:hypothetical protein [Ideonella oryzae]MCO5975423.1 hypothetical protein [Ideonella oryzae]
MTFSARVLLVLVLALLLLPLRASWAWAPLPTEAPAQEAPCVLHALQADGVDGAVAHAMPDSAGADHAANPLCHASAGACCLAVLPRGVEGVPRSQPIASVRYPRLTVPAPAFQGAPDERPPRRC